VSETEARGILDTSVLLELAVLDPGRLPAIPLITAITLAELSVGPLVARTDGERAARQAHLQQAEADFEPLPFDAAAARAFGRVAAVLRQAGRKPAARAGGSPPYCAKPDANLRLGPTTPRSRPSPSHTSCRSTPAIRGTSRSSQTSI